MYCQACGKQIPDESAFCLGCGKPLAHGPQQGPPPPAKRSVRWPYIIIILVLAAVVWTMIPRGAIRAPLDSAAGSSPSSSLPSLFQTPKSVSLFSGSVAVNAGRIHYITFPTDPEHMGTIHITGRFSTTGGMKNDIQAVLCTEDEFQNFSNGNAFRSYYNSGKTTVGTIDVRIPPAGRYVLAFSNKFSLLSGKTVTGEVTMEYAAH